MARIISFNSGKRVIRQSKRQGASTHSKKWKRIEVGCVVEVPDEFQWDTVKTITSIGSWVLYGSLKEAIERLSGCSIERMRQEILRDGYVHDVGWCSSKTVKECIDYFIANGLKYIFLYAEYGWWLWWIKDGQLVRTKLIYTTEELDAWYAEIGHTWFEREKRVTRI